MKKTLAILFILIGFCLAAQEKQDSIRSKSGYKRTFMLGGVGNKESLMEKDDYLAPYYRWDLSLTEPWFNWKRKLNEKSGIQLAVNYSSTFIGASNHISEESQKTAFSGNFDITLKANFINRKKENDKGYLIFWMDSRHVYYDEVPPANFFQEAGTATIPATLFGKWKFHAHEFYYVQSLFKNQGGFVIGKIDLSDWFQAHAMAHPMLHFTDLAFSVNPTVSWSNAGFGFGVSSWLNRAKNFGIILGMIDVAGDNITDLDFFDLGFDSFTNGKFLKMGELVYTSSTASFYQNRLSFTFWHADELTEEDDSWYTSPASKGFSFQGSWVYQDKYIPAFSFGWSDGKGANSLSKLNVSLMNGWHFLSNDMIGLGLNYTKSTITDENQFMSEIFYRFTWSKTTAITPVVKAVLNPALNPNTNFLMYYGVRARITM